MAKLSQLNIDKQCIYSAYLALGCIIKGKTINHEAISVSIFTNLQRLSIENTIPIGNGIFNANNIKEAEEKAIKCAIQASNVLKSFINDKKK
jgi:6,7-dimethyl-8-ribityllumazine synthase